MRRLLSAFTLFVACAFLAGTALADPTGLDGDIKDTVKKTFKVRPGGTLYLDVDRGNIEVQSSNSDMVQIEVERTVDADDRDEAKEMLEAHELEMRNEGNDVRLRSRYEAQSRRWGRWSDNDRIRFRFVVRVPRDFNVDFTSGAGNVLVDDIDGRVEGSTGAGNIQLGRTAGPVTVNSGSGNVAVDGASGYVEVNTGAGNIELRNVEGEVEANTGAGNIAAHITRQPRGDSRLETGAGNVTVYLSGRIGVTVDATSSLGSASTDFPLRTEGRWMRKSFEGAVNGGGPALYLRAGVGNVALKRD